MRKITGVPPIGSSLFFYFVVLCLWSDKLNTQLFSTFSIINIQCSLVMGVFICHNGGRTGNTFKKKFLRWGVKVFIQTFFIVRVSSLWFTFSLNRSPHNSIRLIASYSYRPFLLCILQSSVYGGTIKHVTNYIWGGTTVFFTYIQTTPVPWGISLSYQNKLFYLNRIFWTIHFACLKVVVYHLHGLNLPVAY